MSSNASGGDLERAAVATRCLPSGPHGGRQVAVLPSARIDLAELVPGGEPFAVLDAGLSATQYPTARSEYILYITILHDITTFLISHMTIRTS